MRKINISKTSSLRDKKKYKLVKNFSNLHAYPVNANIQNLQLKNVVFNNFILINSG